jgi:hypothetical protein
MKVHTKSSVMGLFKHIVVEKLSVDIEDFSTSSQLFDVSLSDDSFARDRYSIRAPGRMAEVLLDLILG